MWVLIMPLMAEFQCRNSRWCRHLVIILAASWEWAFTTSMALKVSRREGLRAGNDESLPPWWAERRLWLSDLPQHLRYHFERWKCIQETHPRPGLRHGIRELRPVVQVRWHKFDLTSVGIRHKQIDLRLAPLGKHRSQMFYGHRLLCGQSLADSAWMLWIPSRWTGASVIALWSHHCGHGNGQHRVNGQITGVHIYPWPMSGSQTVNTNYTIGLAGIYKTRLARSLSLALYWSLCM